jgi:hypothetical protein
MTSFARAVSLVAMLGALSACGSEGQSNPLLLTGKAIKARLTPQDTTPADPSQVAQQALATIQGPVTMIQIPSSGVIGTVQPIETNGVHTTWGSANRRSFTLVNGFLTGTRGFGQDLMSSDAMQAIGLILAGKEGRAQHVMRYLTPEDTITTINATCDIRVTSRTKAKTEMSETCSDGDLSFTNTYTVSGQTIVQARQLVSPALGYVTLTRLR